ncbi:MAG: alginate O-acetyltransferase AlgX-related protein, partial [Nitrospiraceae bacterium]
PMTPTAVLMTSVLGALQNATVANVGLSGYGPRQELVALKRYALSLQPKTVVWVFYEGNDLEDVQIYDAAIPNAGEFVQTHWERSFTRNALWAILRVAEHRECTPKTELAQHYGTALDAKGKPQQIYFMESGLPLSSNELDALNKTGTVLEEAYRLCRERGIRFVVVFAPKEYRVYEGLSNFVDASEEVKRWTVNDLPERLRAIVGNISADIDYVDLTPIFKANAEHGMPVFLPDDMHWAPQGHRMAAEALHRLLSSPHVPHDQTAHSP